MFSRKPWTSKAEITENFQPWKDRAEADAPFIVSVSRVGGERQKESSIYKSVISKEQQLQKTSLGWLPSHMSTCNKFSELWCTHSQGTLFSSWNTNTITSICPEIPYGFTHQNPKIWRQTWHPHDAKEAVYLKITFYCIIDFSYLLTIAQYVIYLVLIYCYKSIQDVPDAQDE